MEDSKDDAMIYEMVRGGESCLETSLFVDPEVYLFLERPKRVGKYVHTWMRLDKFESSSTSSSSSNVGKDDHLDFSSKLKIQIPRMGDQLGCLLLEVQLESGGKEEDGEANLSKLAKDVRLEEACLWVGSCPVSRIFGKYECFKGNGPDIIEHAGIYDPEKEVVSSSSVIVRIPLHFGSDGPLFLPLVKLVYDRVVVDFKLHLGRAGAVVKDVCLHACFICLSSEERRRLAQEYQEIVVTRTCDLPLLTTNPDPQGWVSFPITLSFPTIRLVFRIYDKALNQPVELLYIRFVHDSSVGGRRKNGYTVAEGNGFDFLCHSPEDEPLLKRHRPFSPDAMYMIKFEAPFVGNKRSDLVPHGTVNMTVMDYTRLEFIVKDSSADKEYTMEFYQDTTNLLGLKDGMGALKYWS